MKHTAPQTSCYQSRDREGADSPADSPADSSTVKESIPLPDGRGSDSRSSDRSDHSNPATGPIPLAYFITFSTYGTWLHGEEDGSVDREHNQFGTPFVPPDIRRMEGDRARLDQSPYEMDETRRALVLQAVQEICAYRGWCLRVAHVRTNHVHVVVQAQSVPERVTNDFKSYASRHLNLAKLDVLDRRRWTRHGSTRYLWKAEEIKAAMDYTINGQGKPMALYVDPNPQPPTEPRRSEPRP